MRYFGEYGKSQLAYMDAQLTVGMLKVALNVAKELGFNADIKAIKLLLKNKKISRTYKKKRAKR